MALELLKLANFYEVLQLKEIVKDELMKRLETENVLEILVEVDRCITEDEGKARTTIVNFFKTLFIFITKFHVSIINVSDRHA